MASESKEYPCPVCGSLTIGYPGDFDTCEVCGWEDNMEYRKYPDERFCYKYSLNEARKAWAEGKTIDKSFPHP